MPGNVNERDPDERIVEIEVERLRDFRNHPFKVRSDQQMLQLKVRFSEPLKSYTEKNQTEGNHIESDQIISTTR